MSVSVCSGSSSFFPLLPFYFVPFPTFPTSVPSLSVSTLSTPTLCLSAPSPHPFSQPPQLPFSSPPYHRTREDAVPEVGAGALVVDRAGEEEYWFVVHFEGARVVGHCIRGASEGREGEGRGGRRRRWRRRRWQRRRECEEEERDDAAAHWG